jgi:hypothetical protein
MFGDRAVKLHAQLLLRDILIEIDEYLNNIFAKGHTGIAFLVTRPLVREVVLQDEDDEMMNRMKQRNK